MVVTHAMKISPYVSSAASFPIHPSILHQAVHLPNYHHYALEAHEDGYRGEQETKTETERP